METKFKLVARSQKGPLQTNLCVLIEFVSDHSPSCFLGFVNTGFTTGPQVAMPVTSAFLQPFLKSSFPRPRYSQLLPVQDSAHAVVASQIGLYWPEYVNKYRLALPLLGFSTLLMVLFYSLSISMWTLRRSYLSDYFSSSLQLHVRCWVKHPTS